MTNESNGLSNEQIERLHCVVGMMIPQSDVYRVPGADDPTIFADIVASAKRTPAVSAALDVLEEQAKHQFGKTFASLEADERSLTVECLMGARPASLDELMALVSQCYYRDGRVMQSLGIPVRPPFPDGYQVPQGDFSLLEPVKGRSSKIYRDV